MKSIRDLAVAAGAALGVTLTLILSVTITILFVFGWRTETEATDTKFAYQTSVKFERRTDRQVQEGITPPAPTQPRPADAPEKPAAEPAPVGAGADAAAPYVGGNYISGRSAMRYVLDDAGGRIEMYGYDVRRDRRVFVGRGRMEGRRLIVPNFYSFLDDTYGTLKLNLSEDGRTFEGRFEGIDPRKQAPVTLIRLP